MGGKSKPAPEPASADAMVLWALRVPATLKAALEAQAKRSGLEPSTLARVLLQQGLGVDQEAAAVRDVLDYAGRRGLSPERLAELLGDV